MLLRITSTSAQFSSGRIGLSPEQAQDRLHNLTDLGDDTYEILHPIEFRTGEVVDFEGDINPRLLEVVELADVPIEDMTAKELVAKASREGLSLNPKLRKGELVKAYQDFLAQKEEQAIKDARIQELEAKGNALTQDEAAELLSLKA